MTCDCHDCDHGGPAEVLTLHEESQLYGISIFNDIEDIVRFYGQIVMSAKSALLYNNKTVNQNFTCVN